MKWLRISNPGSFDIDSALNMLGASVKTGANPIGMFGSGTKYALAQACRENISVKISTNNKLYTVTTEGKRFRDVDFNKVVLRSETGKEIKTPITTEFGSKDWNSSWFIFRELVSNAMDEGHYSIDIVDGVKIMENNTSVFLPYNDFKHYYDNFKKYFTNYDEGIWVGDGSVYRNGVWVGKFNGCNINLHNSLVHINECRTMDDESAKSVLAAHIEVSQNVEVWKAYLTSSEDFLNKIWVRVSAFYEKTMQALHVALTQVYGMNYCICPNVNDIIRDVQSMGYNPVVLRGLEICDTDVAKCCLKTFSSLDNSQSCRNMNQTEEEIFSKIRKSISAFIPDSCQPTIKIISDGAAQILGQADRVNKIIYIRQTLFEKGRKKELINTIIHEFGHIITGKGDYDRPFTNFFINALTELVM